MPSSAAATTIEQLLQPFQMSGIHLGLERIERLLSALGNPQQSLPLVHVAGTNGKGSVCAYLASILTAAGYRVGRFTSPHLIDWCERIELNAQAIAPSDLVEVLQTIHQSIDPSAERPTLFEVITAAAWCYFAQSQAEIVVMEVGLGGRLDATNVCANPLVSVITSLSRDHWQRLGPTLADIAREKAGILKPERPAVIGPLPPEAAAVVSDRLQTLSCPATWVTPAQWHRPSSAEQANYPETWGRYDGLSYPLPLAGDIQLTNSAIALATVQVLRYQGWQISNRAIQQGMAHTRWPGRLQWLTYQGHKLLIDGAHNTAAAEVLRRYVDGLKLPSITWVMGMLSTKDHEEIFQVLLRPGDRLHLVPVPNHSSADPKALQTLARQVCPGLATVAIHPELFRAFEQAYAIPQSQVILCGSLYLLGHFLRQQSEALA